ncbi:hypothetical protein F2Q68_00045606 [Brassica cretica]|uniref:Uncharacterized protein n=1 Tax=Brassica cretica TaxID=69181 RepID=A0A8S9LNW6_BRACR|nr:hypothetical protein F2Q68_00045606 [Brassica cretica]
MTQHSDSDFDHWAGLMSTLRDSSAWSEGVYYVRRVGETDPQDVYTVFSDHTNDCDVGAKYEWEAISVALFWTLKASLSMPSGDLVKIRVGACDLNDSADLKCHTLLFWPTHLISLTSNMQPARRSSWLLKLKDVESDPSLVSETAPMNTPDIPSGSCPSSRKRLRRRGSAGDTSPPSEHIEPEVESLPDEEFSDDNPDDAPVAADTPENQSKEQRYEESRSVYHTKAQFYPELLRPQRKTMSKFISLAAIERFKDLRGRKFIPQQCISLTDDNVSDVRRIVTGAGSLVDFSPSLINSLYCIPGIRRWENMSSKYLTATNQVMYKLVCSNWIHTMNYTSMNQKRLRFVYMLHHHDRFDFGKLVPFHDNRLRHGTTIGLIPFQGETQSTAYSESTFLVSLKMMVRPNLELDWWKKSSCGIFDDALRNLRNMCNAYSLFKEGEEKMKEMPREV